MKKYYFLILGTFFFVNVCAVDDFQQTLLDGAEDVYHKIPEDAQMLDLIENVPIVEKNDDAIRQSVAETEKKIEETQKERELPEVATIPEEITEVPEEHSVTEVQVPDGISTVSLSDPQGNWLFKRMWYDRAKDEYEKIKKLIDAIIEKRIDFFDRRSALDKEVFDVIYVEIGMSLGEFSAIIQSLIERMEQERKDSKELSEEQQHFLDMLLFEKVTIDEVYKNIELLKKIDYAIENSLSIVLEVINTVRRHERDGWEYFIEIGKILSDKTARELFYKLDVSLQNVKQLGLYLDGAFSGYFAKLEDRARNVLLQMKTQIKVLKEKGVLLKKENIVLEEKIQEYEQADEDDGIKQKPISWWRLLVDTVKSFF